MQKGLFQRRPPESPVVTTFADPKPVADSGVAQGDVQICCALEKRIIRADVVAEDSVLRVMCVPPWLYVVISL